MMKLIQILLLGQRKMMLEITRGNFEHFDSVAAAAALL